MEKVAQRVDIAQVVGDYLGKEPEDLEREVEAPAPRPVAAKRPAAKKKRVGVPKKKAASTAAEPWYVVVDEIVEDTATFEAWPWPSVDPATSFLSFELKKTRRVTRDREDLQRVVNRLRQANDDNDSATRPLRIGDVFEVTGEKISDLHTWESVIDDTHRKRAEAQAALHAMAARPHHETVEEMETLGKKMAKEADLSGPGTKAFSVV